MKVIEKNDEKLSKSESTAIYIVNNLIERVFNKIMTQDSKINLEPKTDIPSSSDDATERDVRLTTKSSTLNKTDDTAILDTSDAESLRCSLPLEKIDDHILQELSSSGSSSDDVQSIENSSSTTTTPLKSSSAITTPSPTTTTTTSSSASCKKRLFCLYCDRIFVSSNLRQKHVERCHSANQLRRSSSRTPGHSKLSPSCMFCGQVDNVGNDLKKLLEHLIVEHSMKYHGCLDCEERFGSKESLKMHNSSVHGVENETITIENDEKELPQIAITTTTEVLPLITTNTTISMDTKKKRLKKSDIENTVIDPLPLPPQNPMIEDFEETIIANVISAAEILKQKELMEKENALKLAELEKQKTSNRNTKKGRPNGSSARNSNETVTSSPRTTRRSAKSSASSTPVKTKSKTNKITTVSNPDENNSDHNKSENSISKTETISIKVTSTSCETSSPPNYEFDENFFTCVSFNIQENLLNHLDGKLHTNNELSPMSSLHAYHQAKGSKIETNSVYTNANGDDGDDGNNLALTALTPVTTLLTSQIGIDAYRQIEYGSKAPKHHVTRKHYVKYNFRSRKQKPSDMDISKDISKLDMWTQVAMKMRQQKIKTNLLDDEINRRTEQQVEELNRILDTRGPFQDLHEEALNSQQNDDENNSSTDEVKTVLEDILINVFDKVPTEGTSSGAYENNPVVNLDKFINDRLKNVSQKVLKIEETKDEQPISCNRITTRSRLRNESTNERLIENETLSYFNLTRTPAASSSGTTTSMSITRRTSIDMKTTTESLYKLGLDVKQMNQFLSEYDHEIIVSSSVELSGEWARPRIYICGACGVKITNLKLLEDHKQFIHPHVWCAHYEFVGNQSEFYPHLNIPGLGRILENEKKELIRNWEKSSARQCSKCQKECNTLGDLHRHMLECGGDWSWMLAKKKCKYRPFGARSRRRRVMELKRKLRVRLEGGSSSTGENTTRSVVERRRNRSKLEGPRPPRPSDADTIQRMLANLPPKRATRKIMSLKEQGLRKPNRLNPNKTNVNTNRTKQLLKSPKANNKNETIKAANQKMKQALQRNLRSRNQLNNIKNNDTTIERKISPRTTRRSASNSPKNEKQISDNTNIINNNRKQKVQKVLASKIIDSNTALGPKSKIFSRKKTRFGETVVTRLRNKILLAQKYINSDNTVRLTRSRGLHVAKQQIDDEIIKDRNDSKKKSTNKNDNKSEESDGGGGDVPKTKRRLRSLKFLTKTLRSQKKINEVSENAPSSTSPARRSNRMRILSRIQRKLPSFNRRNKNETQKNENDTNIPIMEENSSKPTSENIDNKLETNKNVEETKKDENLDQPPILEKIIPPTTTKPKTNIDYCIESVVANITGQVTYKEYPRTTNLSGMDEPKKSSFSLKTFTQNMRNIGKKISNKNEPLNLAIDTPSSEVSENEAEKIQLGKRKRVISTQTDITPNLSEEEQPPILFPQIPLPPPLPLIPPVSNLTVPIIPSVSTAIIHDTISETIEEVITKYTVESESEDDLLTKSNKKLKINTNGIEKCDSIPKNLSNQNFPMPILEAVGPPNDLKRGDSIVTIPILLPVVSHVIISTGTQINSNLLEKIMDTSINNFQLNNIVPNDKTNPLLNQLSPGGGGKNSDKIIDDDEKSSVGNKEYHNYVIETPMQKLIQNGLYPVLPSNNFPNGENSTQKASEDVTKKDNKNKSKGLKKPIKKLNDCINMLKQKLMSSSSTESPETRGDILKIPTPKFNKPPIFSDPHPKKITEAPFSPVKKSIDNISTQGLDFSLPKNVVREEDDQTSPIDLSCTKLFVNAPIANEVEHIVEIKSVQKPKVNFSDLPRQMELLANQAREAERNQKQQEKLIKHHHPIILNVPEVVETTISNIELQKNQNEIIDVENRTSSTSLPRLITPSNLLKTTEFDSNDNISKIPIDLSSHPSSSHVLDVHNLISNLDDNKKCGRKRNTRRIGTIRTRPIRKCNTNEEELDMASYILPAPRSNDDIGSDTSDDHLVQDLSENIPQNLVKPPTHTVDNLTEIINQVAKNTINKPKDNLTEIINQVAENTINKEKIIEVIPPPSIIEIEKPKEIIPDVNQSKDQISSLMKVRKKPGRKPKSVFEPLDKTPEILKPEQTMIPEPIVITEQIANVVIHHSTPEIKTPDISAGNLNCITDDFDLENALPLFTVGKISPQDPKTIDLTKNQPDITTPTTVVNISETTKRARLKPGRKPKKLLEQIENVSNIVQNEPESINISSDSFPTQIIDGKPSDNSSNISKTDSKKPGRKPRKQLEDIQTSDPVIESQIESQIKDVQPENISETSIILQNNLTTSVGEDTETDIEDSIETLIATQSKKVEPSNTFENTDIEKESKEVVKEPENIPQKFPENDSSQKSKVDIPEKLTENLEDTQKELTSGNSGRKKPGRKPKKIFEEKSESEDILKKSESFLNKEDQNSNQNDFCDDEKDPPTESTSKELTTETLSSRRKPGRKPKKIFDDKSESSNSSNDFVKENVLEIQNSKNVSLEITKSDDSKELQSASSNEILNKTENQNFPQIDSSQIMESDISNESSPEKNSSQYKKPGRKSKKPFEKSESSKDEVNSKEILKESENVLNQNSNQNASSEIFSQELPTEIYTKKPGRKPKKIIEDDKSENLNDSDAILNGEDENSTQKNSSQIIESDITNELTTESTTTKKKPGRKPKKIVEEKSQSSDILKDPESASNMKDKNDEIIESDISKLTNENISNFPEQESVIENSEIQINESTNETSQFKRPGRKPKKSLKQPEKDEDISNDKVINSEITIEEDELQKNILNKKSGRRSRKLTVDTLEEKSESERKFDENVSELQQIDIKPMPVRKSGRRSKNSSVERSQKIEKADIDIQNILDNDISLIETPLSAPGENAQEIVTSTEREKILIPVRKSGRRSTISSMERSQKIENSDIDIHNILDIDPTIESLKKITSRKSKKSLEEQQVETSVLENTKEIVKPNLEDQNKAENKSENSISSANVLENSTTIVNALENSSNLEINENSNDLSDNSSYKGKSGRKSRKIALEQTEIIDNEISEDSNTSKSSTLSRKSGRKSKRIFEHVENITEFDEDNEFYQNARRKSERISKNTLEQTQISNLILSDSMLPQVHIEPIKTSNHGENVTEKLNSKPPSMEENMVGPVSSKTTEKLLEKSTSESETVTLEQVSPLESKTARSKQKSKVMDQEIDSTFENQPTENIIQESMSSRITLRRKSTRLSEPVIDISEITTNSTVKTNKKSKKENKTLSDSEDELPLAILSKQNERVDKNIEKSVIDKEIINCKDSTEKISEIPEIIEVIPEKIKRQSEKVEKINEIEKYSAKIEAIPENPKKQSGKIEDVSDKIKKQSTEKSRKIEDIPETKKQSTKIVDEEVVLGKIKKQSAKFEKKIEDLQEKISEIEDVSEKIKKQNTNIDKINENENILEQTKKLSVKINTSEIEENFKKQNTKQIEFHFKQPEIRLSQIKTNKISSHQTNFFTPGDETTDDEGDIPLAQRFGISKVPITSSNTTTETKVIEDKSNEVKKTVEETIDEESDKTDVSSTAEENLSDKDSENKKRRGRPKKKDVISDEDYQFPRRITRRSNSSIYGNFEDVTGEIIQDQQTQIITENPVESTTNTVLSNILVENNQNIENLEQDSKKPDKKIEKLSIKTSGEKLKTQENEFSPVDEVDAPEENELKSEIEKGPIIHKLKKPRKISMPPPPPPPPPAPKECEENLRMRITFKKVSKLNSTIGLQLTDFENVQIITTPKTDSIHSKSTITTLAKSIPHNLDEETDEERSLPLSERTFLQKPKLQVNTDDKNVFQFKQPGLPFSRAKRRMPAVFNAIDETTDEEGDVPLAQRFGIKKPVFNSNAAEETEDEDRIIPLAERLEKLRKKTGIISYKNSSAAEETEDEDRIIPLAERLAKLRQLQVAKSLHMKLPDPADETEDEDRILPLAERIARENKKQFEVESLKTKINLKKLPVDPAEETEDEERIIPLAERIAKLNKVWQKPEPPKPIAAIPNPADETEDEDRIIPLALRIAKKKETMDDGFHFKEPVIPELLSYQKKRKALPPPADETTDEEGDVPLARRFGLPKPLDVKKRKNSLDESSSVKIEITPLQTRKRRKSLTATLDVNETSIDYTKMHVKNMEKSQKIDVFDFNESDSPVVNSLDDIRNKSKVQNIEEPTKMIIETEPKKITTKLHVEKHKKSSVKKIFKIRKKRRKGKKLKFTNRRYKKVLSKIIIEEPEIIKPSISEIKSSIPVEDCIKNIPDFQTIPEKNDNLEKTTEIIEDDDEVSRNSSLGGGGGDDGFDNRTDISSLSDTTVPESSEAVILERHSPLLLRIKTNFKAKGKRGRPPVKKISIAVDNTENYCEICNKHFCRADNLIKHKMTFTHIAKLSELEAKETEKRRLEERQRENMEAIPTTSSGDKKENTQLNENNITDEDDDDVFEESSNFGNDVASRDLDELAMKFIVRKNRLMDDDSIGNSDEASSSTDAFNLGNGVNYPDLVTSHQPKRYRSLGERKSFDSNQSILSPEHQLLDEQNSPQIPDSIIQEDDDDDEDNENEPSTFDNPPNQEQSRPKSQNNVIFDYLKKSTDHPTSSTFEFISQTNQFEENFTRKKLNRDEELFLECCSLLKNNSKSRKIFDERNNDLQAQNSPHHVIANSIEESTAARIDDWSNSNSVASDWLSQKGGSTTSNNNMSFNKRGQSTNVSSFKFNTTAEDDVDGAVRNKQQNFEEIIPFKSMALNVNEYMDFSNINVNQGSEHQKDSSKEKDDFSEINSLLSTTSSDTSVGSSSIHDERSLSNSTTSNEDSLNNSDDLSDFCESKQDDSTVDSKKIPTKGALKIFEGIKVSIPTQEINLAEVLSSTQNKILQIDNQQQNVNEYDDANSKKMHSTNSNSNSVDSHCLKLYKNGVEVSQSILKTKKSSSSNIDKDDEEESISILSTTSTKRSSNKSATKKKITKTDKKSPTSKTKTKDVYDFEDSQDEFFEGDQQLNFKTYRDQKLFSPNDTKDVEPPVPPVETNVVENNSDSDDDHHDYIDSFSVDESSHSSDEENVEMTKVESPPQQQLKKVQSCSVKGIKNENKKGMIMGRIFKHVVKSKTPEVGSSPNAKDANTLFDNLIGEKSNQESIPEPIVEQQQQTPTPVVKKASGANKTGKKPSKRTKPADSSSDDDFTLTRKPSKKINRRKKGNTNTKDENESGSGINLEQEIRECIGVAGRKSQRKCTSGKQNILVEFWSSDELSDGEKRIKNISESNIVDENNVNKENEKIEENLNNIQSIEPPTIENNPLNETIVNINDEKITKSDNIKQKEIQNPKVHDGGGGQGNGTTLTNVKRKPTPRVQANKVSRKCSKIRNKTKARGRRKKLLPNNNNLDTQKNNHHHQTTTTTINSLAVTRRKRSASEKLYYWSSSSDDEFEDFIEVKPIRDDPPDDEDRPMHHGWIVGESPKKLVTMLAQAKGSKKVDAVYVKEQGKRNRVTL